ncbi:MAG: hypothetical protein MUD16_12930 [Desulfobacterales bacterium]|jgi:hypothetical protein|nr:hypothetical protein [Desulfobacterales bacterium]
MKRYSDIAMVAIACVLGSSPPAAGETGAPGAALPAIDAAAPGRFETATFALG